MTNLKMFLKKKRKLLLHFFPIILTLSLLIVLTTPQCPTNHEYPDSTSGQCLPCAYNCLTCLDQNLCAVCVNEFYLDDSTNTCLKCPFGCQTCQNATSCVTCNTGLYIDGSGNCLPCSTGVSSCSIAVIEQCHDQYFLLGGICAGCLDNCKKCEDFVTCTECLIGYYLRTDQQACLACSSNCEICTDAATCTSCAKGYTISNSACILEDCSSFPFCIKCNALGCLSCEQSKYLASNNTCVQGASILCEEATGPYYTNCEIDDYDCANYAKIQDTSVCLPYSATQYAEYIYGTNDQSNCVSSTCGSAFSQLLSIAATKSFYQVEYHINVRLYKQSTHTLTITQLNTTTQAAVSSKTHTKSIALELSTFGESEASCSSCPFGQVYLQGTLVGNGYQLTQFNVSDQNGAFTVVEYVFKFYICTVDKCETCTTVSDCTLCIQPYLLQLVKCVTSCDAGFYKYSRYCLLSCPSETFSIQSSYQCQLCTSPCATCFSQTKCLSCVDGYFLQGNSCLLTCTSLQTFGNSTSHECEPCPNPCSTCVAVNSTYVKCSSCMVGYLYIQEKCVFNCPLGVYEAFLNGVSQCEMCDVECTGCYMQGSTCEGCVSGYLLYSTYCNLTTTCPSGYFISTNNTCAACQFPCATCFSVSTNCTSCLKGSLYQSQCTTTCPSGYYTDSTQASNTTCQPCANNCLTCISSTLCVTCPSSFYLFDSQCLSTCPDDFSYQNALNNTCTLCSPPCKECSSATTCISCATGYLDGTTCTLQCNTSSYINSNFQCAQCTSPCIECYSVTQCVKCQLPQVLYSSGCVTVSACESLGKYLSYTNDDSTNLPIYGECKQCTYPCATCQTSSIMCLTCVSGYLYLADMKTCQQACPSTYYVSSAQCLKCSSNCYECSITATNCTSCSSGTYLDPVTNKCVSECSDGYYADNEEGKCVQCVAPCATCYNIYFCKSCLTGIFYNKVCVTTCPSGTIFSSSLNQCELCTSNCLTCSLATSNCTTCISGYFFNSNNTCTSSCPSTFYPDPYTQTCERCISPCLMCGSSTECVTCVGGYFLYAGKSCVSVCPTKYFENSLTMQCDQCNLTICETCKDTANTCVTCATTYFFDSITSTCLLTCPSGYYPEPITRTCKACQYPCQQCTNTSYCTKCESNYKLYLQRCYSSCPVGYYGTSTGTCQQCPTNCEMCSSSTNCTKCSSGFYVENGGCVTDCSVGLYQGKQDMTNYDYCVGCQASCVDCEDYNTCVQCAAGFYIFNGLCLTECPILHYSDSTTLSCQPCPSNCVSCLNSTYCSKCVNSYIYNNLCYPTCPTRTYIFNSQQCQNCVSPCDQCESQFTCTTCLSGYFYYHAYCVTECPQGVWYYPHNDTCAETCVGNKYEAEFVCYVEGCGGKLVQMGGYCLANCPSGYYVSKSESCIPCSSNQDICDNLFVADLQVLRSQELTLILYFSQQAQLLSSITDVNITFADFDNSIINLTLTSFAFTPYSLTFKYDYQQVKFVIAYLTIPYLDSQQTEQAISACAYDQTVYYFNDYESAKEGVIYSLASFVPLLMTVGLFVVVVINLVAKTSYFLQLLDLMQLVGACLYLEIQYPIFLEKFLNQMGNVLFMFIPKLIQRVPYTFSSPKFIFYNTDTSFSRTHTLTFLLFLIIFIGMIVVVVVNKYFGFLPRVVVRIKYRNLNDLFSVLSFPLMLFSFSFVSGVVIDLALSVIVILLTVGWIVFISNLIIQAEQMGELMGLLSDYQAVSSKLGLMYTPFSYIRRFVVALVFCVFPQKPLAALTLLLIFTILILICLFFYQPFASQITDYVSMYLEFTLIVFIILIVTIGLDILGEDGNKIVGTIAIVIVTLAMVVGLGWLCYLTLGGVKKFCENFGKQKEQIDTQDCIKSEKKSNSQNAANQQNDAGLENSAAQQNEYSASNLVNQVNRPHKKNYMMEDMESDIHSNSNKEEFKHWNDEQEDSQASEQKLKKTEQKRAPQILLKKVLQERPVEE